MDLSDREEHRQFRQDVKSFLAEHGSKSPKADPFSYRIVPRPYEQDVIDWQRLLVAHGYASRTVPKEYGGFGAEADILKFRIIADEFFAADVSLGMAGQGISMFVPTVLEHGTDAQKEKWVEPTINAELVWAQGYSEPNAGSDLASLQTSAIEDGDDFLINGQKIWTSSAHIADMIFCLVRTEPDAPKHKGISYIIFPMDTPGIEIRPLQTMTEHPSFNEVFFTDVRVPQANVIGRRGNGWKVANSTLKHERGMLSNANGSQDRLNRIRKILTTKSTDGRYPKDDPSLRDRFIALQASVESMRFHEMRLTSSAAKGNPPGLGDMICKWIGCDLNHDLDALAIDALEEYGIQYDDIAGYASKGIWQQLYMYDLGLIIGGGTAQIQKNIISERGLGMPREPKVGGT
jgi:alkylation response protein AidB-like acyl-CoA dehydrogenase